jgi:hypothetical protein
MPPSAHNHQTGEITDVMLGTVNALITGYRNAAAFAADRLGQILILNDGLG